MSPKKVLEFPMMLWDIVTQMMYYVLTEAETFLLAVASVLYGYHFGWVWGLTIFVSVYFVIRMTGGYVAVIASALRTNKVDQSSG